MRGGAGQNCSPAMVARINTCFSGVIVRCYGGVTGRIGRAAALPCQNCGRAPAEPGHDENEIFKRRSEFLGSRGSGHFAQSCPSKCHPPGRLSNLSSSSGNDTVQSL